MRYCISEPRKNRLPKQFETLTVEFAKHRTRMLMETLKLVRQLALIIAFYHYQLVILMKRTRSQCDVDLIFALENFAVSKRNSIKQLGQLVPTRYDIFGQAGCTNSRVSLFRAWEAGRRRYGCWLAVKEGFGTAVHLLPNCNSTTGDLSAKFQFLSCNGF